MAGHKIVGRTPWSAADALVGMLGVRDRRVQGDPRGPGGPPHHSSAGQTTVEFALSYAGVLLPLTFGLIFISQLLWVWHSVADFTRQGAGYAATHCWQSSAGNVIDFMRSNVPLMPSRDQFESGPAQITVTYSSKDPNTGQLGSFTCDGDCSINCVPDTVTVGITGYEYSAFVTSLGLPPVRLPNFQTTVSIESAGCDPEQGVCLP